MASKSWITQVRKGLLELCILNILHKDEMYGYDIVKQFMLLPEWEISGGTVYPILSRLKKDGFVNTSLRESNLGPARKYYKLSKAGNKKCQELNENWKDLKLVMNQIIKDKQR